MKLFIFSTKTPYGIAIRGVVHRTKEDAFNFSDNNYKSLKDLGWDTDYYELIYFCDSNDSIGIKFCES